MDSGSYIKQHFAELLFADDSDKLKILIGGADAVLIGGNHLAIHLPTGHPSHHTDHDSAREWFYERGQSRPDESWIILYDLWCCWRSIMQLRDTLDYI